VRSFDRKKLAAYLARNYRAPDMVVAAAGAVDHAAVVAEAERRFAGFTGPAGPPPEPARYVGGSHIQSRDLEQAHVALAMHGLPQRDPNLFSLQVFTSVLGGGMSSRLFQEVREIRGLCYAIYAFHAPYSDTGMFGLYAGTDTEDVPELMRVVVDEITGAAETLNEAEIARAKTQMKAGLLMALESSSSRTEQLARQMFAWGRPIPLEELVARIDAVTVESARAAGRALIARGRPRSPRSGPAPDLKVRRRSPKVWSSGRREVQMTDDRRQMTDAGDFERLTCPSSVVRPLPSVSYPHGVLPHRQLFRTASSHRRRRCALARAADVRLRRMVVAARGEPRIPHPVGADLAADDLTRASFRRRIKRYSEDSAATWPIRSSSSARTTARWSAASRSRTSGAAVRRRAASAIGWARRSRARDI